LDLVADGAADQGETGIGKINLHAKITPGNQQRSQCRVLIIAVDSPAGLLNVRSPPLVATVKREVLVYNAQ
jgi:hypothetical protein